MVDQFIWLVCRYIGAIGVACVVSFWVYVIGDHLLVWAKMPESIERLVPFVLVGFFGVFLGALCLPSYHRRFGAFVLLLLGLFFDTFTTLRGYIYADPPLYPLFTLIIDESLPLAGGGLLAALTVCFWRRRPNNSLQATAAPPRD
jgi:uncharacterized membrane protein YfcA